MLRALSASGLAPQGQWAAVWLLVAGSLLGGCASSSAGGSGSTAAPPNYKQAVAARMREMVDVSTVKSAQITRPHERFMGLVYGGTRQAVCVSAVHPNIIGMDAPHPYMFYFNDGRADGFRLGSTGPGVQVVGCGSEPYMPFPELRAK